MDDKKSAGIGKGTPGPGRKPGTPNRATIEFRQTVRQLLEDNADNVGKWLKAIAEGDIENGGKREPDPYKALDMMAKLAEYAAPKLGRVEHVGDGGGPVRIVASPTDEKL